MKYKILLSIFVSFIFGGCKVENTKNSSITPITSSETINYSSSKNWAVLPGNYPENMKYYKVENPQDSIDVFYVYPTLIVSNKDKRWNVSIEDSVQKNKVLNSAVHFQASAWANSGNLYVPYYRQAHIRSYSNLENGGKKALLLAYSDVRAAFEYYLEHYNHGHGIILAGHSQGSTHIAALLHDFFDGKTLQNQLVAAYIPGIGFDKNQFGTVSFMEHPDQIGGFVTWNTFKKKFDKANYKWYKGKVVINPVTWDETAIAERKLHKGFLYSNGKMYRNSFVTHVGDGVIWISTPHFPYSYLSFLLPNYHTGDVNLFWEDIRENALLRVQSYQAKKKNSFFAKAIILN